MIEATEADAWSAKVESMADEIEEILVEEKEDKQLAQAEMQVKRGENIIVHEAEIKGRPKRTWFESEADKRTAKKSGRAELNGPEEGKKIKKKEGKLSNKDKKKMDAREERIGGKGWKKGRAERDGKGALAAPKPKNKDKGKKKVKGGKPAGKKFGGKR